MPGSTTSTLRASTLFRSTQVRRPEQIYSLLYNFPSLLRLDRDLQKLSSDAFLASHPSFQEVAIELENHPVRASIFGASYPAGAPAPPGFRVPMPEDDEEEPERTGSGEPPHNGGGSGVDLSDWTVRDQGNRGTCVAHALVACREYLGFEQGELRASFDLSEQFLFWAAKTQGGDISPDEDGTSLECAQEALARIGVCHEDLWPYDGTVRHGNVTHAGPGIPTGPAREGAILHCHACAGYAQGLASQAGLGSGGGAARVRELLIRTRRPVAISVPVFSDKLMPERNNWNSPIGIAYGEVLDPPPNAERQNLGHAVCVVDFAPDGEESQGGYFVFRNSWGTDHFGRKAPQDGYHAPAPGYGQISASYVEKYLWELCVL